MFAGKSLLKQFRFKMNKNKRGLSPVIATVLTIMLTVAAVAALSAFVVPFVRNSLQKSSECMDYGSYYTFEESGYNCYSGSFYAISIQTSFDKELANEWIQINIA
jgi:flagellin-like protein